MKPTRGDFRFTPPLPSISLFSCHVVNSGIWLFWLLIPVSTLEVPRPRSTESFIISSQMILTGLYCLTPLTHLGSVTTGYFGSGIHLQGAWKCCRDRNSVTEFWIGSPRLLQMQRQRSKMSLREQKKTGIPEKCHMAEESGRQSVLNDEISGVK